MKILGYTTVVIFDGKLKQYGGHWGWLSRITTLDYLMIGLCFRFGYFSMYYDGQHHVLHLGLIDICWGGPWWTEDGW